MKIARTITTSYNGSTYYDVLELSLKSQTFSCTLPAGWTKLPDEPCADSNHEHAPVYCLWHMQTHGEHEVGRLCLDCDMQWFFESDWSSDACRAARKFEGSSRLRLFMARLDRWLAGWKWHNAWTYKP